jgi:hypothetical protein
MAKKKRLTGEAYWRLQDLLEEGDAKVKEYGEWARKECRRLKLLPDVTDFVQGVVWSEPLNSADKTQRRRQVQNVEDEDVIAEALRRHAEIDEINRKIDAVVRKIAMAAGVRADQVNARKGEIDLDLAPDVEDLDLKLS